ncbi:thioredoxin family protein [Halalkalibacter krulwichiae]|uniref:Thioredoxin C-1 n=1 Tax=Halalkalibacter krulwichiae TaxID=199441 RepID=A0A1X9MHD0_9BACI|nr:thioredoxin family protein [Halalkalibacter krulwichiae]ARK32848.1 Thioredoxin C-1 [Halalkalibacter krulwichiae]
MKKILIFGGAVILLFVALVVVSNAQQTQKSEGNPFGKSQLHPATIEIMDDPNYQNIILPEELETSIADEEEVTVYFYSSTCQFCKETTPRLVPIADEKEVNLVQYNLLEFEDGWEQYDITATPTVVHYENGDEAGRIVGAAENEEFEQFFENIVLN